MWTRRKRHPRRGTFPAAAAAPRTRQPQPAHTRAEIGAWSILAGVGTLSVAAALFTEPSVVMLPGWTYMLLPFVMPAYGFRIARARSKAGG